MRYAVLLYRQQQQALWRIFCQMTLSHKQNFLMGKFYLLTK